MFLELYLKYKEEIAHLILGICFAFLGYFMVTVPAPIGTACGLLCALYIYDDISSFELDRYFDYRIMGWFSGLLIFMFLSPQPIIVRGGTAIIGSILCGIVNGIGISKKLDKDFRIIITLLFSCFPLFNISALVSYVMLLSMNMWIWFGSLFLYLLFFSLTYVLINKKDLLF